MKCPECNHQNPDDATMCESCYYNFPETHTSKLAILSLVLGISSLILFVITGLPALILGIISNIRIKRSKGRLEGRPIALAGIITSLLFSFFFFMLWRVDAPPIPDDYTMADLRSAPAEYEQSYHLLVNLINLCKTPTRRIETNDSLLTREDTKIVNQIIRTSERGTDAELTIILTENANAIKQIWDKTQKARDIIHQLNEYPEIVDLTSFEKYRKGLLLFRLLNFIEIYKIYSMQQNEENAINSITSELIALDSVFRKLCPNIRPVDSKLGSLACMSSNIKIANNIVNKPETSKKTLELLEKHFIPLTEQDLSLKNCAIFEYINLKDIFIEGYNNDLRTFNSLFKINSTLRLLRNHCNEIIELLEENTGTKSQVLDVCPSFYPFKDPVMCNELYIKSIISEDDIFRLPLVYRIYNPGGSTILQGMNSKPAFITTLKVKKELKIHSELLQIVLSKRLGKDLDSNTLSYGDEYIIDIENKKIFSPGPDGIKNTEDDIILPINPEVLGLSE